MLYLVYPDPRYQPTTGGFQFTFPAFFWYNLSVDLPILIYIVPWILPVLSLSPLVSCPRLGLILYLRWLPPSIFCLLCGFVGGRWYMMLAFLGYAPFILGSGVLPRTVYPPSSGRCTLPDTSSLVRQNAPLWWSCLSPGSP
jgi:hypothetical protein